MEALQAIERAQQVGCFEYIEIWTPEGNTFHELAKKKILRAGNKLADIGERMSVGIDPMAVGIVHDLSLIHI